VTFFAQGAGHGYSGTLKIVQNAIMIKLATNFDYANYNIADKTVTIGGGTVFSRLINATYAGGRELSE
jgi:FAD/FMN-containing dehydrogenase